MYFLGNRSLCLSHSFKAFEEFRNEKLQICQDQILGSEWQPKGKESQQGRGRLCPLRGGVFSRYPWCGSQGRRSSPATVQITRQRYLLRIEIIKLTRHCVYFYDFYWRTILNNVIGEVLPRVLVCFGFLCMSCGTAFPSDTLWQENESPIGDLPE